MKALIVILLLNKLVAKKADSQFLLSAPHMSLLRSVV